MPSAIPMMVGTKRNMLRSRAAKKMMPYVLRGVKRRSPTSMHTFLPAKMIQHKSLDQEVDGTDDPINK